MLALYVLVGVAVALPGTSQAAPNLTLEQVQRQVSALERQAEIATEQYNGAQEKLRTVEARLGTFQATAQRQQVRTAGLQRALGAMAAAEYRSGGFDPTLELLFSPDPEEFLQRAATVHEISREQTQTLRSAERERQRLAEYRAAAARQHAELARTRADLYRYKVQVESKLQQAQRLVNSLSEQERQRLAEARRAKREADRRALERLAAAASPSPSPSASPSATPSPSPSASPSASQSPSPSPSPSRSASASPTPTSEPSSPAPTAPPATSAAQKAVDYAKAHVGDAYIWGAAGPDAFDCSGLTMMAWRAGGVSLPHQSGQQYDASPHVSRSNLQPGDLVFFYTPISHVGIYIGGGNMIHASNPSDGVKLDSIASGSYWAGEYVGASRPG